MVTNQKYIVLKYYSLISNCGPNIIPQEMNLFIKIENCLIYQNYVFLNGHQFMIYIAIQNEMLRIMQIRHFGNSV